MFEGHCLFPGSVSNLTGIHFPWSVDRISLPDLLDLLKPQILKQPLRFCERKRIGHPRIAPFGIVFDNNYSPICFKVRPELPDQPGFIRYVMNGISHQNTIEIRPGQRIFNKIALLKLQFYAFYHGYVKRQPSFVHSQNAASGWEQLG